jgi:hypothetical protein
MGLLAYCNQFNLDNKKDGISECIDLAEWTFGQI